MMDKRSARARRTVFTIGTEYFAMIADDGSVEGLACVSFPDGVFVLDRVARAWRKVDAPDHDDLDADPHAVPIDATEADFLSVLLSDPRAVVYREPPGAP